MSLQSIDGPRRASASAASERRSIPRISINGHHSSSRARTGSLLTAEYMEVGGRPRSRSNPTLGTPQSTPSRDIQSSETPISVTLITPATSKSKPKIASRLKKKAYAVLSSGYGHLSPDTTKSAASNSASGDTGLQLFLTKAGPSVPSVPAPSSQPELLDAPMTERRIVSTPNPHHPGLSSPQPDRSHLNIDPRLLSSSPPIVDFTRFEDTYRDHRVGLATSSSFQTESRRKSSNNHLGANLAAHASNNGRRAVSGIVGDVSAKSGGAGRRLVEHRPDGNVVVDGRKLTVQTKGRRAGHQEPTSGATILSTAEIHTACSRKPDPRLILDNLEDALGFAGDEEGVRQVEALLNAHELLGMHQLDQLYFEEWSRLRESTKQPTQFNRSSAVVFGTPLRQASLYASTRIVMGARDHDLPIVVVQCAEELYRTGIYQPHLFRAFPNRERLEELVTIFDREEQPIGSLIRARADHRKSEPSVGGNGLDSNKNPTGYGAATSLHLETMPDICALLTRYLSSLPEPILSPYLFDALWQLAVEPSLRESMSPSVTPVSSSEIPQQRKPSPGMPPALTRLLSSTAMSRTYTSPSESLRILTTQFILHLLPSPNFSLLVYLLAFFSQVVLVQEENGVGVEDIGRMFGAFVIGSGSADRGNASSPLSSKRNGSTIMTWLLRHWDRISETLFAVIEEAKLGYTKRNRIMRKDSFGRNVLGVWKIEGMSDSADEGTTRAEERVSYTDRPQGIMESAVFTGDDFTGSLSASTSESAINANSYSYASENTHNQPQFRRQRSEASLSQVQVQSNSPLSLIMYRRNSDESVYGPRRSLTSSTYASIASRQQAGLAASPQRRTPVPTQLEFGKVESLEGDVLGGTEDTVTSEHSILSSERTMEDTSWSVIETSRVFEGINDESNTLERSTDNSQTGGETLKRSQTVDSLNRRFDELEDMLMATSTPPHSSRVSGTTAARQDLGTALELNKMGWDLSFEPLAPANQEPLTTNSAEQEPAAVGNEEEFVMVSFDISADGSSSMDTIRPPAPLSPAAPITKPVNASIDESMSANVSKSVLTRGTIEGDERLMDISLPGFLDQTMPSISIHPADEPPPPPLPPPRQSMVAFPGSNMYAQAAAAHTPRSKSDAMAFTTPRVRALSLDTRSRAGSLKGSLKKPNAPASARKLLPPKSLPAPSALPTSASPSKNTTTRPPSDTEKQVAYPTESASTKWTSSSVLSALVRTPTDELSLLIYSPNPCTQTQTQTGGPHQPMGNISEYLERILLLESLLSEKTRELERVKMERDEAVEVVRNVRMLIG